MYEARLTIKSDWFIYCVEIFKDNILIFKYNFQTLTNASKFINLFFTPYDEKGEPC